MTLNYTRPHVHDKQRAFIDDPSRFTFVEAGTKAGKTAGMLIWLNERIIQDKLSDHSRWWVAPVYGQAEMAFNRLWRLIPENIKHLFKRNQSDLTITYPNNQKACFKSGEKPDNLYGDDVYDVVIDEASRMREESWFAIQSTLTYTLGNAKVIGNVKGKKNWFYRECAKAKSGHPNYGYHKLTSLDNPYNPKESIEHAQLNLPKHVYDELFLAIPADDGTNPFGENQIRACIKPLSEKPPVVFGVDLAKSVDWTVIIGLDEDRNVCRFYRFQKPWFETMREIVTITGGIYTLVDSTGVGDPVTDQLQKLGGNYEGMKFTSQSKQQMMEGLSVSIQSSNIGYPDGNIVDELLVFEYEYTRTGVRYSAPEGMHDDCVCALALANYAATVKRQSPIWSLIIEA